MTPVAAETAMQPAPATPVTKSRRPDRPSHFLVPPGSSNADGLKKKKLVPPEQGSVNWRLCITSERYIKYLSIKSIKFKLVSIF